MQIFIDVISEYYSTQPNADKINERLNLLQQNGAKIKDVKMSTYITSEDYRYIVYLITYEADQPIFIK